MRRGHVPVRKCIGCQRPRPKHELLRLVLTDDGLKFGNVEGRGFYLCRDASCLEKARKGKNIRRLLGRHLTDSEAAEVRCRVSGENCLDGTQGKAVICCSCTGGDPIA